MSKSVCLFYGDFALINEGDEEEVGWVPKVIKVAPISADMGPESGGSLAFHFRPGLH